ncbi:MAG: hypothetical protein ABIL09_04655, partial [Gemmatimonadota bacterium]
MSELTPEERRLIDDLLADPEGDPPLERLLCAVPLVLGLVLFVGAAFITLRHLDDHTARWVMLPGAAGATLLF